MVVEYIRQIDRMEVEEYSALVAAYTEGLGGTLADILATIRGRKQVIFFSKGYSDSVLAGASLDELGSIQAAMQSDAGAALARADSDRFGSADVREALDDTGAALRARGRR